MGIVIMFIAGWAITSLVVAMVWSSLARALKEGVTDECI